MSVEAGVDIDAHCKYPYEANNQAKFLEEDLAVTCPSDLEPLFQKDAIRLLAGCAPCQPFSTYSRRKGRVGGEDRWRLVLAFAELARETEVDLITMENVPQLADHDVFQQFCDILAPYKLWREVVDCADYGVPQSRRRLVVLGSRLDGGKLALPEPALGSRRRTVRETIGGLAPLDAGGSDPDDPLHMASRLSSTNLQRIRASKPGGTWRDWDEALVAECHRQTTGVTYPSVYGRMEWDTVSPTVTTQCFGYGNGRFGHPEQDRAISLREAAMLQTFPRSYVFAENREGHRFNRLGRLIGNAVPVRLAEVVGRALLDHVSPQT